MRKLIVTENITVDGVIDATDGWFAPDGSGEGVDESDLAEVVRGHREAADAFLVGRVTFEQMRSYWPKQIDSDETGISSYLNRVGKYVVSTTLRDPGWEPTTVLAGDLRTEVEALKAADGADIVVTGSIRLVHGLIAAGLVDEYRLLVHPVVIGKGARLFEDAGVVGRLELVESRSFRNQVTLLTYRSR